MAPVLWNTRHRMRAFRKWPTPPLADLIAAGFIGAWLVWYGARAIAVHGSLGTNAYDLTVFDYALWSWLHGHPGWVPFTAPLS